jgi:hypothetical protein
MLQTLAVFPIENNETVKASEFFETKFGVSVNSSASNVRICAILPSHDGSLRLSVAATKSANISTTEASQAVWHTF